MPERITIIPEELLANRDHVIEVVSNSVQSDLANPNLSETFKEASISVAEEVLSQLPPKP